MNPPRPRRNNHQSHCSGVICQLRTDTDESTVFLCLCSICLPLTRLQGYAGRYYSLLLISLTDRSSSPRFSHLSLLFSHFPEPLWKKKKVHSDFFISWQSPSSLLPSFSSLSSMLLKFQSLFFFFFQISNTVLHLFTSNVRAHILHLIGLRLFLVARQNLNLWAHKSIDSYTLSFEKENGFLQLYKTPLWLEQLLENRTRSYFFYLLSVSSLEQYGRTVMEQT